MRDRADGMREPLAVLGGEPPRDRRRAGDRDLLADHGPHGQLGGIRRARAAAARARAHQRADHRRVAERGEHLGGIEREIEQRRQAACGLVDVARVGAPQAHADAVVPGRQAGDRRAVRQPQRAPVLAVLDRLDAGDRPRGDVREQPRGVERRAGGEPQLDRHTRAGSGRAPRSSASSPALRSIP